MNYFTIIKVSNGTIPITEERVPDLEIGQTDAESNDLKNIFKRLEYIM